MKAPKSTLIAFVGSLFIGLHVHAETVKDREGSLRQDKATFEQDARWNYNDVEKGFAAGAKSQKPILVVLRCVPCLSCKGIDGAITEDASLTPLLDQFECVRLINANALDLELFQFDYDLSLSVMVFHADRTVYGRFGSWSHQKDPSDASLTSFKKMLERALALHKRHDEVKEQLRGKKGPTPAVKQPVEMASLASKYGPQLNWHLSVVKSCVHCHQIGDAMRQEYRQKNEALPLPLIFPMPSPETVGLKLDVSDGLLVTEVNAGSLAASAGLLVGDQLVMAHGQPLISTADFSWVLHGFEDEGTVALSVKRGAEAKPLTLALPSGWRMKSDISGRVGTWDMRAMALGGMVIEALPEDKRLEMGLVPERLAVRVKHVGQYDRHAGAKKVGIRPGDIITGIGDIKEKRTESEIIGHLLSTKKPGDKITISLIRDGEPVNLRLSIQ